MKLGRQGEITFVANDTYLGLKVNSFESNVSEFAERPFVGEIKIQPDILPIWKVLNGREEFVLIRSGKDVVKMKYKEEKQGVRLSFYRNGKEEEEGEKKYEMQSSYLVRGSALRRLKQEFLEAIKQMKVLTISEGSFHFVKTPSLVVMRNDKKETFLTEDEIKNIKDIILQNYILSEPIPHKGKHYTINEDKDLVYRGVIIPKSLIKDLYVLL